jgi:hypothetical protein
VQQRKTYHGEISARQSTYQPGTTPAAANVKPGNFILTHSGGFAAQLIRLGQSVRYRGDDAVYAWWTHAALIVSEDGDLIEAVSGGLQRAHLSDYQDTEYVLVEVDDWVDDRDRRQIRAYAEWMLDRSPRYGWPTTVSIALAHLLETSFYFGLQDQCTCSGLVAAALQRSSLLVDGIPSHMMPANLAEIFRVTKPLNTAGKGRLTTPGQRRQLHPNPAAAGR